MQREIDDLKRSYVVCNESGPLPISMAPPMMKRMLAIGKGQELRRANFSPAMKNATTSENTRARFAKAREMML